MTLNLLSERWLPVRRAGSGSIRIAPWEITTDYEDDPVVALDTPRPDFNGAMAQFLIGLLQTAYPPADPEEWADRLFSPPPQPAALQAAFSRYRDAFNLDGDGPRFMQDRDPLAGQKPLPISALLIDTAGSSTHFVKALPQQGLSPALAAMALYALQTNAPAGGVGHRTSLRGGGPLTTLVMCAPAVDGKPATLWESLWLNVLQASRFHSEHNRPEDIFPWLAPTRTSEKGSCTEQTTRMHVNPLQMFWGMPRRIRLDFEAVANGTCGMTGEPCDILVPRYRTRNYGTNYTGAWEHILSPHTHEADGEILPVHPKGAINYRHWLGLVQPSQDRRVQRRPAAPVLRFRNEGLARDGYRLQLWAFGYDMDNMKPRCWCEATMPLFQVRTDREAFEGAVKSLIEAAGLFLGNLRSCLKDAWFSEGDPRRSGADIGFLDAAFWADTEGWFYDLLHGLAEDPDNPDTRRMAYHTWHERLNRYTLDAFHRHANTDAIAQQNPRRIARAYRRLLIDNRKKGIGDLLDLPRKSPKSD